MVNKHLLIVCIAGFISVFLYAVATSLQGSNTTSLLTQYDNGNAQACDTSSLAVKSFPAQYPTSVKCLSNGQIMYSDDQRFTFFSAPASLTGGVYIQTENIRTKEDRNLSGILSINAPGNLYIAYRKIPNQTAPAWLRTGFEKITAESYVDLPSFLLRKNDLGLIGVYDLYRRTFASVSSIDIGPASDNTVTAYSMYIPIYVPQPKTPSPSPTKTATPTPTPTPSPTPLPSPSPTVSANTLTAKVLAIGLNPTDSTGNIAQAYFPMNGLTSDKFEDYVFNGTVNAFKELSNNEVRYEIVQKIHVNTFPTYTNGNQFTVQNYVECVWGRPTFNPTKCEAQKQAFDMKAWITSNHICETAAQLNVDEIWVMSPPYIMTWESQMIGPSQPFWVNSSGLVVPQCQKHYIIMDATYERSDPILHIYGHRIESVMNYVTSVWHEADRGKYWENFSAVSRYAAPTAPVNTINCGNAHFPANGTQDYDYTNTTTKPFSCPDWKNFPFLTGAQETINCSAWGCTEIGWHKHWMGSIPRSTGQATLTSFSGRSISVSNNWWKYIMFPETAISFKNGVQ